MIRIAVCDDDINFLTETMRKLVYHSAQKSNIQIELVFFTDGTKLIGEFKNGKVFDIVILDIDMPKINGKELARRLRLIDTSFFLVFMTSYESEVYNTIQYKINSFISKKNDISTIQSELTRVFKEYSNYKPEYEVFKIMKNGVVSVYKIPVGNIMAFYIVNKILYLKTCSEELILQEKIFSNISEKFRDKGFLECYRNYLVNVKRIQEIREDSVILDNGEEFPVSKRSKKALIGAFNSFIMAEVDK